MSAVLQDLRFALRMLAKKRGFAAAVVGTLALGIGPNSAIFSVVNAILLQPLPYQEPDRLVTVSEFSAGTYPEELGGISGPNLVDLQKQNQAFAGIAGFDDKNIILTGGEDPEQVVATIATGNFFQVLGAPALLGRTFSAEDEESGEANVAVLGHGLWQRRFGGNADIVGQKISIDGDPYVILGVMPPQFIDPLNKEVELWVPMGFDPGTAPRGVRWMVAVARLKPGVSLERAQADVGTIAARLAQEYPDTNADQAIGLGLLRDYIVGDFRPALLILFGAVLLVLLIACANVTNLLLVHVSGREQEIAIRNALGASRATLVRQLVTESALLGLLGGALGILLAYPGVRVLLALYGGDLPRAHEIGIDGRVLAFTLGIGLLTGLLSGVAPVIQLSRRELSDRLKDSGGRSGESSSRNQVRSALVVTETALALVLLIGAGLLLRSLWSLQQVDLGFRPENVLTAQVDLSEAKYPDSPQRAAFFERLVEEIAAAPGVLSASAVSHVPLRGENVTGVFIAGQPAPEPNQEPTANFRIAMPGYFETVGIPVLRGRTFARLDREGAPLVVVVDQKMAERFWGGRDPVGQQISFKGPEGPWLTVIGVVGTVKLQEVAEEATATVYAPFLQRPRRSMVLLARTSADPLQLASPVRQTVRSIDPDQPVHDIKTLEDYVSGALSKPRFNLVLLGLFAALALLLAAIGTYSVLAYSVAQRRHEIGVRMALGAQRADVMWMVVRRAMLLAGLGLSLGIAASLAMTRLLSNLLFGVQPADPPTFAAIPLLLILVVLAASYLPARRATAVDPVSAFRAQ